MKLYLSAKCSNKKHGYTPDGIQFDYGKSTYYLTTEGDTDFSEGGLFTRTRGDLIPLWRETESGRFNVEYDENKRWENNELAKFYKMLAKAKNIQVFVYPTVGADEDCSKDKFEEGDGKIEFWDENDKFQEIDFKCTVFSDDL